MDARAKMKSKAPARQSADVGTATAIRRWRLRRWALAAVGFLLVLAIVLDRLGVFGWPGDDWARFDGQTLVIEEVVDGQSVVLRDAHGRRTTAQLLGVAAPVNGEFRADLCKRYLQEKSLNKSVVVKLESTRSRDSQGRLLAYLYLSDTDFLNCDAVRDGQAYVDRRVHCQMQTTLTNAEDDARKHGRGLWAQINESQMPAWRQEWLRSIADKHTNGDN
jgi:endonuclease YncB( thermonuclease family)